MNTDGRHGKKQEDDEERSPGIRIQNIAYGLGPCLQHEFRDRVYPVLDEA